MRRLIAVCGLLSISLACAGGGFVDFDGGSLVGARIGEYAASYARHAESSNPGIPCTAYALGQEAKVGDWSFVFEKTWTADAETALPWIKTEEERKAFGRSGGKALVIKYKVRNDSPVKKRRDVPFTVYNTDGDRLFRGSYNGHLLAEEHGLLREIDAGGLPPGKWVDLGDVYAVDPAAAANGVAYLTFKVDDRDARGNKIRVLKDHAVIDLGVPGEHGPHINPSKR